TARVREEATPKIYTPGTGVSGPKVTGPNSEKFSQTCRSDLFRQNVFNLQRLSPE
ncbi:hypothetical protein RUM43_001075, partial [Polyplax serrata]